MKRNFKIFFFLCGLGFVSCFTLGCKQNLINNSYLDYSISDIDSEVDENNPRHCFPLSESSS